MRFDIKEIVTIKASGKVGEVISYNETTGKYGVKVTGGHITYFYSENALDFQYDFSDKFELGLIDLLIDINLPSQNLTVLNDLHNRRQLYTKQKQ